MNQIKSKFCSKCGRITPIHPSYFYLKKKGSPDLAAHCIKCARKKARFNSIRYFAENKEKISDRRKKRYQTNRKMMLERGKIYRKNNKQKISEGQARHYQANKESISKRKKQYEKENKEKIAERKANYYQANKERIAERSKQYRSDNKEKIAEYHIKNQSKNKQKCKKYYDENRDKLLEYSKSYFKTEQGKANSRKARQKRRVLKFQGTYEIFDSVEIFERDGYRCQLCGKKTRPDYKNPNHPLYPNLDHIIPLVRGGNHTRENTQCLCHLCNTKKGSSYDGEDFKLIVCK